MPTTCEILQKWKFQPNLASLYIDTDINTSE